MVSGLSVYFSESGKPASQQHACALRKLDVVKYGELAKLHGK